MKEKKYLNFSENNLLRGFASMAAGVTLLLHTLGIIEAGINLFLILLSISMIIYGFIISGLYEQTMNAIYRSRKAKPAPVEKTIKTKTIKTKTRKKK